MSPSFKLIVPGRLLPAKVRLVMFLSHQSEKAASWKSADVFSKFYNNPVAAGNRSFEEAILHDVNDQ